MRAALFLLIAFSSLGFAAPAKKTRITKEEPAKKEEIKVPAPSEIGLNNGQIIRGTIINVTATEVIYREGEDPAEKKLGTDTVIFVRSADGSYRFIYPPEAPVENKPATAPGTTDFFFTAGIIAHFADNSTTGDYTREYGNALAAQYNQQTSAKGFTSNQTRDAAAIQWHFAVEPRLVQQQYMLGLHLGYAALPKTTAVISSAAYTGQLTLSINGTFYPVAAIFYYRLYAEPDWGLNLGFGAGAMYSSVQITQNNGTASDYQIFTSLNPILIFKPEFTYRLGPLTFYVSVPIFWAESRDVTDGEQTLLTTNAKNVISANLTGVGIQLAAGMKLF